MHAKPEHDQFTAISDKQRLIDANKITADSELIKAMLGLFRKCQFHHTSACLADNCFECAAQFFMPVNSHLLPSVKIASCNHDASLAQFHCDNRHNNNAVMSKKCPRCKGEVNIVRDTDFDSLVTRFYPKCEICGYTTIETFSTEKAVLEFLSI